MNELEPITPSQSVNLVKKADGFDKESHAGLQVIKRILDTKPGAVIIKGKRHIEFGDWIALGNAYGITIKTGEAVPVEIFDAKGFKAKAQVVRIDDGMIIGGAEAYCLDTERNWKGKDYFQLASMAQTRAGSKALSNVLRFVVEIDKTLSSTPAEEMPQKQEGEGGPKKKMKPKKSTSKTIDVDAKIKKEPKKETKTNKSFKELAEQNQAIQLAIESLEETNSIVDQVGINAKLLDLNELGKITLDECNEAIDLLG